MWVQKSAPSMSLPESGGTIRRITALFTNFVNISVI